MKTLIAICACLFMGTVYGQERAKVENDVSSIENITMAVLE